MQKEQIKSLIKVAHGLGYHVFTCEDMAVVISDEPVKDVSIHWKEGAKVLKETVRGANK